jgi:HSP20 family molecular chaperone IbpA
LHGSITLPAHVMAEGSQASVDSGVLKKRRSAERQRAITYRNEVSVAGAAGFCVTS